ncbi:MAG: hypothetical protein M1832_004892 [Thelocarpon impressellum]|nr:MAG: hypothetical protein M1832_004892 [Thelocarpon impressellum]
MTEPGPPERPEEPLPSPLTRRQRAPTITIDTSAVSPPPSDAAPPAEVSDAASIPDADQKMPAATDPDLAKPPQDLKTEASFESKNGRPTSGQNVVSPGAKGGDHNFLAVPSVRSRVNSLDSDDAARSTTSYGGETVLPTPTAAGSVPDHVITDEEALKPDPGTEEDFEVQDNKFAFSPGHMTKLMNPKSLPAFRAVGGLRGIEKGLRSDRQSGLSSDETTLDGQVTFEEAKNAEPYQVPSKETEAGQSKPATSADTAPPPAKRRDGEFADRKRIFKDNRLPEKKIKSIFQLAWIAYNDKVLILLTVAAVISLALGLYQTFGQKSENGEPRVDWVEGVAIMTAVVIVVVVGAANDYQKERQFVKLNKKKEDRTVKVIRSGRSQEISIYDVLVGDVMHLEPGDLVPVDGVFIDGFGVKADESSATGESDLIKKTPADEVLRAMEAGEDVRKLDPFIISGSKLTEGVGTFMVTGVGVHSSYGKILVSLREGTETTPLQMKLNRLAENIAKLGGAAALLLFVVLLIKFLAALPGNKDPPSEKGQQFLQILIVAITIVVVAVPEGLPLAVTLALAFATTRMLKDNNLVRVLRACETMGNATTVCSDKTGTLTQNKMTVVAGTVGLASRFSDRRGTVEDDVDESSKGKQQQSDDGIEDVLASECVATLAPDVKVALEQSIAVNSTAFEGDDDGQPGFIGSKTETALLGFARHHLGLGPLSVVRSNANVVQFVPFDSARKCMATIVRLDNGTHRMYVKGASEILLGKCTRIVRDPTAGLSATELTEDNMEALKRVITSYATRSLRTIALLYADFDQFPPPGARTVEGDSRQVNFNDVFKDMVFLAVVGIQDPLREGVPDAVRTCQRAGVFVRMVTGDNIVTAQAIATECGIYTPGGVVMEGPQFRKLSSTAMNQVIPRLQVLARSSPEDKRKLVARLKELGETVAVTGDGTNDAPALKTADVGFSMGIAGTEVAKEASAIILMDDNFSSIIKAIMWGRAVNDAFQLTVNITAVLLAFISAVSSSEEKSVLTAVQLLWVNLIMDTFAALALATDAPTHTILDRKPDPKSAPLITVTMWKMILGQSVYQLAVTFVIYFAGTRIFSYESQRERDQLGTLVFNTFVWMQIFNQYNSRRLDNKINIFEGIHRNYFFIGINIILVAGQVMIIFIGGQAFSVKRLNGAQWIYSVVLGALSMPVAVLIRLIPDKFVKKILPARMQRRNMPQVVVSDEDQRFEWNQGLEEIRNELTFLKKIRGGRLNQLKFKLQHPRETLMPRSLSASSRSRSSSIVPQTPVAEVAGNETGFQSPPTPDSRSRKRGRSRSNSTFGPAAAMAGVVAGSIAGWSPVDRTHADDDAIRFSSMGGRAELEAKGAKVHPDTKDDDPVIAEPQRGDEKPPSQVPETAPDFKEKPPVDTPHKE